jgi:hypothetical protein
MLFGSLVSSAELLTPRDATATMIRATAMAEGVGVVML